MFTKSGTVTLAVNVAPNHVAISYDHNAAVSVTVGIEQTDGGISGMIPTHYGATSPALADATLLADTAALASRWQAQAALDNGFTNS